MDFFGILATPLGWILTWLYDMVGNYAIALIILTVIVKLCLYPFYKKQILSTAGMSEMGPKLQAIQRQYADDKEMMNQKMTELYKEEGVNPMAGCLPMIIQMIVSLGGVDISGWGTVLSYLFASSVRSGVIAMVGGLIIVPVVSLFTRRQPIQEVNKVFACYEEKVSVAKKEALD